MQSTDNLTTKRTIASKVIWGFMLENTLFTEFEEHNHAIIEAAYKQRKGKHGSRFVHIVDANLPKPGRAKVYFGVVQNHLRMPGTRYYVNRRVMKDKRPSNTPQFLPMPVSTSSSSTTCSLGSDTCSSQMDPQLMALFSEELNLLSPNYLPSASAHSFLSTPDNSLSVDSYCMSSFQNMVPETSNHAILNYQYSFYNPNMYFVGTDIFNGNQTPGSSSDSSHNSGFQDDIVPWSLALNTDYFSSPPYDLDVFYDITNSKSLSFCQ